MGCAETYKNATTAKKENGGHPASPKYCQEAVAQLNVAVNAYRDYLHFLSTAAIGSFVQASRPQVERHASKIQPMAA